MDREQRQQILQELSGRFLSSRPVAGRANTPMQKKQVLERLYALWEQNPKMRLGQLLGNMYSSTDPGSNKMYYAEDFELIEELEGFYDKAD